VVSCCCCCCCTSPCAPATHQPTAARRHFKGHAAGSRCEGFGVGRLGRTAYCPRTWAPGGCEQPMITRKHVPSQPAWRGGLCGYVSPPPPPPPR
jgi:hypothetical protein